MDTISSPVDTTSRWTGNDYAGISAWAAEIPYGPPADPSTSSTTSSPSHSVLRPPQLLSRHPRITPPALCTDTLRATPPPTPLRTSKSRRPTMQLPDVSRISLKSKSALTESSLATPASSHPMPISRTKRPLGLDGIYSHVRSWVTPSPTSPARVMPFMLTPSAFNTGLHPVNVTSVKVVSPPDTPHGFLDDDAPHWKFSTIILDQPHKRAPDRQLLGCHLTHEFLRMADQNSSFRARGRKASRAVAWDPKLSPFSLSTINSLAVFTSSLTLRMTYSHAPKGYITIFTIVDDGFLFFALYFVSHLATFLLIPAHDASEYPPLHWLLLPLQKR